MNLLDLVIVVAYLGLFALAFLSGTRWSLAALIALVVGVWAAAYFYGSLGDFLVATFSSLNDVVADLVAFLVIMGVIWGGLVYLLLRSFHVAALRTRRTFESRGGVALFSLDAIIALALALLVVGLLVQVAYRTSVGLSGDRIGDWIEGQVEDSVLAERSLQLSPRFYNISNFLTPGTDPTILRPVDDQ